jgi:hypothetical protein
VIALVVDGIDVCTFVNEEGYMLCCEWPVETEILMQWRFPRIGLCVNMSAMGSQRLNTAPAIGHAVADFMKRLMTSVISSCCGSPSCEK